MSLDFVGRYNPIKWDIHDTLIWGKWVQIYNAAKDGDISRIQFSLNKNVKKNRRLHLFVSTVCKTYNMRRKMVKLMKCLSMSNAWKNSTRPQLYMPCYWIKSKWHTTWNDHRSWISNFHKEKNYVSCIN